jgi:hypothetical protein
VEQVRFRRLVTPELVLIVCTMLVGLGLVVRTSSPECHAWKQRVTHVAGAYLAAAGEREYPNAGAQVQQDERESLRRETSRMLGGRPFGCL